MESSTAKPRPKEMVLEELETIIRSTKATAEANIRVSEGSSSLDPHNFADDTVNV